MTDNDVLEYFKSQYLACREDFYCWSENAADETNSKDNRNMCRRFANESYTQCNLIESMARDLFNFNMYNWYLEQL